MMEELESRYAELNPDERWLKPYFDLEPDSNREKALRLGRHYMGAYEQVMCPTCEKGDKGMYDAENRRCVECWYRVLARVAKEVARDAEC